MISSEWLQSVFSVNGQASQDVRHVALEKQLYNASNHMGWEELPDLYNNKNLLNVNAYNNKVFSAALLT